MEERTVATNESVEHGYTFEFHTVFEEHVVVYGKYLDRGLPRCLHKPPGKLPMGQSALNARKVRSDDFRDRFSYAFFHLFDFIPAQPSQCIDIADCAQHRAKPGQDVLDIRNLANLFTACLYQVPRPIVLIAEGGSTFLGHRRKAGDRRYQGLGLGFAGSGWRPHGAGRASAEEEGYRLVMPCQMISKVRECLFRIMRQPLLAHGASPETTGNMACTSRMTHMVR